MPTEGTDDDIEDNRAMKEQTYTSPERSQNRMRNEGAGSVQSCREVNVRGCVVATGWEVSFFYIDE